MVCSRHLARIGVGVGVRIGVGVRVGVEVGVRVTVSAATWRGVWRGEARCMGGIQPPRKHRTTSTPLPPVAALVAATKSACV